MIRHLFSDLTDAERAAAVPDPRTLCSFGEHVRMVEELTPQGRRQVPVTFEIFYEYKAGGFGNKAWVRYKDRPHELIPQHDITTRDTVVQCEPFSPEELAVIESMRPKTDPPIPDPPPVPLFEAPNW